MKKEDLLSDEFLKQFKNGDELNSFLSALQKRGIEKILEGELDSHLSNNKQFLCAIMLCSARKVYHITFVLF